MAYIRLRHKLPLIYILVYFSHLAKGKSDYFCVRLSINKHFYRVACNYNPVCLDIKAGSHLAGGYGGFILSGAN
jgi:hypothetical protein